MKGKVGSSSHQVTRDELDGVGLACRGGACRV
jgi:hypothetical protein